MLLWGSGAIGEANVVTVSGLVGASHCGRGLAQSWDVCSDDIAEAFEANGIAAQSCGRLWRLLGALQVNVLFA